MQEKVNHIALQMSSKKFASSILLYCYIHCDLVKFNTLLYGLIGPDHAVESCRISPAKYLVIIAQSARMAVSKIDLQKLPFVVSLKSGYSWGICLPILIVAPTY